MGFPEEADFSQQQVYWWTMCVLLGTAFFLTAYAVYEWQVEPAYQKDVFKGFIPMFIGNIGFIVAYLPFHTYNAFSSAINGREDIVLQQEWVCKVESIGIVLFMMYSWSGMTMVAYALNKTIRNAISLNGGAKVTITQKMLVGSIIAPAVLCIIYYFVDFDNLGPYRSLYCNWKEYNAINVGFGFVFWILCATVMIYLYWNSYKMMHGHFSAISSDAGKKAISNMISMAVKFTSIFVICGFPVLVEIFWALNAPPPVELTMVVGFSLSTKCILDAILILTMPLVKQKRNERKQTLTGTERKTLTTTKDADPRTVPESASSDV